MKQEKHVFRASYSVLSLWKSGQWENAISTYFKYGSYETDAMRQGKDFHNAWENEVKQTKRLPVIFGGNKLNDPMTERKIVHHLDTWLDLVGVIDLYDKPTIYEYKTGVTSAAQYANTHQCGIYALLATLDNLYVEKTVLLHHNQHTRKNDVAIVWTTDRVILNAMEFVRTYASEMHSYMIENNLYETL